MKPTQIFLFIFICFSYQKGQAQNPKVYITDKVGATYAYVNVTKTYERVAEKGYKSVDLFQKLGNAYYEDKIMDKAAKWYGELFALTSELEPIYFNQYANALNAIGENEKAKYILEKLKQKSKTTFIK